MGLEEAATALGTCPTVPLAFYHPTPVLSLCLTVLLPQMGAGRGAGGARESWIPPLPPLGYPAEPAQLHPLALPTQRGQGVDARAKGK